MTSSSSPSPLSVTPAPWKLTGKAWLFPIYTPFSDTPVPLPEGSYAPLDQGTGADQSDSFHGGVGTVMIVRYDSSDVGPYDEIIFVPGLFHRHKTGKDELDYHLSITRIYVSADASTINGRRNWSIPKHTALFSWTPSSPGGTLLTISHPSSPSSPFFRCLLRDSALTPFSIHIRTSWLEWRLSKWLMQGYSAWLYQPALQGVHGAEEEKVKKARETGQNLEALVGSEEAYRFTPPATAWSRLAKIEVAPPMDGKEEEDWSGFGDGVGFPKFRVATEAPLCGRGMRYSDMKMDFPVGNVVQD